MKNQLRLGLFCTLLAVLYLSFGTAQESSDDISSTDIEAVQALIEQAMMTDNQLVKLLGAQIKDAAEAQQEIEGLQLSLDEKTAEVTALETETNTLKSQYANLSGELDSSKQEISGLQEQILERANELQVVIQERDIIQSAFARVQDASDKSKVKIEELETLLSTNTTTIEALETKVKTLEAQYQAALIGAETIKEEALKLPDVQDKLATVTADSARLSSHIERVTNSRDRLKAEHERTLLQIDSFEQSMTDAIFRANALEAQLRSADTSSNSQVQSLRQQYADAQSQIFSLEGSLEGARAEVDRLQTTLDELESGELTANLSAKDDEITSLKDQVATLRTTIINLPNSDKLLSLQQERDALQSELDTLKEQLASLQANDVSTASTAESQEVSTTTVEASDTVDTAEAAPATDQTTDVVATTALAAPLTTNAVDQAPDTVTPSAASELPTDLEQAKNYASLKLNEYYLFRDRVTDLGANVTLLELNQREEALINLKEAQSNVANLMGADIYVVEPGDTLTAISSDIYGSINRWEDILTTNNFLIDDPDVIFPGFELIIPQ